MISRTSNLIFTLLVAVFITPICIQAQNSSTTLVDLEATNTKIISLYGQYKEYTKDINVSVVGRSKGSLLLVPIMLPWIVLNQTIRVPWLESERLKVTTQLRKIITPETISTLLDAIVHDFKHNAQIYDQTTINNMCKNLIVLKKYIFLWLEATHYENIHAHESNYENRRASYSKLFAECAYKILEQDSSAPVDPLFDLTWNQWFKKIFLCKKAHAAYKL